MLGSAAGAPPAGQLAATRGELGGTGGAIEDAGTIDHPVGSEDTIAGGSLAGDVPADGRQRKDSLAVATAGMDALSLSVTVIAITEIVVLGAITACRAVGDGLSDATTLVAFAVGAFVGGATTAFGIASFFDLFYGTIASGKILDVGTVLILLEVIDLTETVEADEALAFGETASGGRIAGDGSSAGGTVLDGLSGAGVAGAGLAHVLRATVAVVGLSVGRSSAIGAIVSVDLLTDAVGIAQQAEATSVLFGRGTISRGGALLVDFFGIRETHAGAQLVKVGRGILVRAVVVLATIFARTRRLAEGGCVPAKIGNISAGAAYALRGDASLSSAIGDLQAVALTFLQIVTVDAIAGAIASSRGADLGGGEHGGTGYAAGEDRVIVGAVAGGSATSASAFGIGESTSCCAALGGGCDGSGAGACVVDAVVLRSAALLEAAVIVGGLASSATARCNSQRASAAAADPARAHGREAVVAAGIGERSDAGTAAGGDVTATAGRSGCLTEARAFAAFLPAQALAGTAVGGVSGVGNIPTYAATVTLTLVAKEHGHQCFGVGGPGRSTAAAGRSGLVDARACLAFTNQTASNAHRYAGRGDETAALIVGRIFASAGRGAGTFVTSLPVTNFGTAAGCEGVTASAGSTDTFLAVHGTEAGVGTASIVLCGSATDTTLARAFLTILGRKGFAAASTLANIFASTFPVAETLRAFRVGGDA